MKLKSLSWDSTFFNLKVGELILDNAQEISSVIQDDLDLIYVKSFKKISLVLDHYTCSYTETKLIFERNIVKKNTGLDNNIMSVYSSEIDRNGLYRLALESGKYSRFKLDPNFSERNFKDLFKAWIDNSLNGSFSDGFLVYKLSEKIVGFVTYHMHDDYASIGLIAVDLEQQGTGVGSQLIRAVENQLLQEGITNLRIPTQLKNKEACNFYQKLGYSPLEKTEIKHYWRDTIQ